MDKMDNLKDRILAIIEANGPVTTQDISNRLSIAVNDPIRFIRKKIRQLIIEDKIPIASSMQNPMGYFIATQSESSLHYIHQLKSRILALNERLSAFEHATARQIQLLLIDKQ